MLVDGSLGEVVIRSSYPVVVSTPSRLRLMGVRAWPAFTHARPPAYPSSPHEKYRASFAARARDPTMAIERPQNGSTSDLHSAIDGVLDKGHHLVDLLRESGVEARGRASATSEERGPPP